MTINFGIEKIEVKEDVNKIIKAVADCRVCTGVENFLPDDIIYLPDARKRGYKYYSDACPVILGDTVEGNVCNPCIILQKAVMVRKENERKEIATRKLRYYFIIECYFPCCLACPNDVGLFNLFQSCTKKLEE